MGPFSERAQTGMQRAGRRALRKERAAFDDWWRCAPPLVAERLWRGGEVDGASVCAPFSLCGYRFFSRFIVIE